jgi:hypothetical protein
MWTHYREEGVVEMAKGVIHRARKKPDHRNIEFSCPFADRGGGVIPKICIHDHECRHCAFAEWVEEMRERQGSSKDFQLMRCLTAKPPEEALRDGERIFV